ncbi:MAG TPA: ABC transporter permease [Pirellulaceae bacterium]|nr:ABC transporter permease [Pirellulaceae bacterium]
MQHPIIQILIARVREFLRVPEAVFWVYVFPILMVIALGIAFRNQAPTTWDVDLVDGPGSARVVELLRDNPQMKVFVRSRDECEQRLRTGKSDVYVVPSDEALSAYVSYLDPTRPGSLAVQAEFDRHLQQAAGRQDVVMARIEEVSEPGGRYIDFLIPGLLGMGLMGGGLWGVGFAIVDIRIKKLLKRMLATPMRKSHLLLGIMASRLVFMVPEILLIVGFSWLFFGVQIYGSLGAVICLVLVGAIMFSGIGLLVGARARTLESASGLMNLVMLPMWTLCGIFFSNERFPAAAQPLIQALPLTALIDSLRAVMNEGATLVSQWHELASMGAWTVGSFVIALLIFRWSD